MRRTLWVPAAAAVLVVTSCGDRAAPRAEDAPSTAKVARGELSATVSQNGTLAYQARPGGAPYSVVNRARGTYTRLPESGDRVGCGGVLYRVDDKPVVLLCGAIPAYRDLHVGDKGADVGQLNGNLHVEGDVFSAKTQAALQKRAEIDVRTAVFLPEPVRIAKVAGALGGPARPGSAVLSATSDRLHVQVALDPMQQGGVHKGDRALITLPGNRPVSGRVEGLGRPAKTTIPAYVGLDHVARARGFDRAPVQVDITTRGVKDVLSVPVTAIVGRSGGGFAVEVVRAGGERQLVAVRLGLFDTGGGRVQVEGDLREGDRVAVPSL